MFFNADGNIPIDSLDELSMIPVRMNQFKLAGFRCGNTRAIVPLLAILLSSCSQSSPPVTIPVLAQVQPAKAAPQYCAVTNDAPPKALASNPNYVQFSVNLLQLDPVKSGAMDASDFRVTDGSNDLPIAFFKANKDVPQSVGILIDRSGSMVSKLAMVRRAASLLVHTLPACDDVFVYAFGGQPEVVEDFTVDKSDIEPRLMHVTTVGTTPLFDSLNMGLEAIDKGHYPDRAIVIFTDGVRATIFGDPVDNASKLSRQGLAETIRNSRCRVFVVGVGTRGTDWGFAGPQVNAKNLQDLSDELGSPLYLIYGTVDSTAPKEQVRVAGSNSFVQSLAPRVSPLAANPSDLENAVVSIASQIDHAYTLGVIVTSARSSNRDAIQISLAGRTGRVFARRVKPGSQP